MRSGAAVSIFCFIFFLTACEEGLDLVLPSKGTYPINAYVNEYSLNEYSIIRQHDSIRPYFVNSVANDPDIKGLMVFFQTSDGQIVGKKTRYTLVMSEPAPVESRNDPDFAPKVKAETVSELPAADEAEVIDESLVTLESSETDVLAKEPVRAETEVIPQLISTQHELNDWGKDRLIMVANLDRELPSFELSETIAIGQYFMVFQILGERRVLDTIEYPIFFLGNAELSFDDIQRYLPGSFTSSHLVAPGTHILLEAQVFSDERLDPYMIWYSGRKRIGEGKLSEGANLLIWKAPDQTGFHIIKAAVFPFQPRGKVNVCGKIKELSLPVSSKSKNIGYFSENAEQFMHWYQFQSNLLDSKELADTERSLRPKENQTPQWLPHGGMYGLSVGPKDVYLLPDSLFMLSKGEQGAGQLRFRIAPRSDGTLFQGVFETFEASFPFFSDSLTLDLSLMDSTLVLTLSEGSSTSYQESIALEALDSEECITAFINFKIKNNHFTANMYLENTNMETEPQTLILAKPLSGAGNFQVGAEKPAFSRNTSSVTDTVAIFNELGIAFIKSTLSEPDPREPEIEFTTSGETLKEPAGSETT